MDFSDLVVGESHIICFCLFRIETPLPSQASDRKHNLTSAFYMHRFLSDYRDLISWITDIKSIILADELAKDVAGAEALLEKHQEHKVVWWCSGVVVWWCGGVVV